MSLQIQKAERKKAKLRIGLGGASGSGKTYSALLLANGMAPWGKIGFIDTENGSGHLYSHLAGNDPYQVVGIQDNFAPEQYIEAIKLLEDAGMEVIIIDSITHEWDGKGGCLELVEQITQASSSKNSYTSWAKITPRHQKFIDAILQCKAHVITTVRKKQDYDMSKDGNNRTVITKVGMKEVTRDGFEYELTLAFNLSSNNLASVSKDRTGLFMNKPEFKIDQSTGKTLLEWSESGAIDTNKELISREQIDRLLGLIKQLDAEFEEVNRFIISKKKVGMYELSQKQADEVITLLEERIKFKQEEAKTVEEGAKTFGGEVVVEPSNKEDLKADSPAKKAMLEGIKKSQAEKQVS